MSEPQLRRIDFSAEKLENAIVIKTIGSVDFGTFSKFSAVTDLFLNQGNKNIIYEFSALEEMCLDAIQFLRRLNQSLIHDNGSIRFVGLRNKQFYPNIQKIFPEISGLLYSSVELAEKSIAETESKNINKNINALLKENIYLELSYFDKKTFITGYSKILNITPKAIVCSWPSSYKGSSIGFNPGFAKINFKFNSPAGLIGFTSEVVCEPSKKVPVFLIPFNFSVEKARMRAYERLNVNCSVNYINYKKLDLHDSILKGNTTNISGGGINVISRIEIPRESQVLIDLKLQEVCIKPFVGTCVRIILIEKGDYSGYFDHGISFHSIFENDRNEIIQHIIQKKLKDGGRN